MATIRKQYSAQDRQELTDKVLSLAVSMSVNQACKLIGLSHSVFNRWMHDSNDSTTKEKYMSVRYDYQEKLAGEIINIADEQPAIDNFGKTDAGSVNDKRVRIDARKWLLSKLAPKRYGERIQVAGDEASPLQVVAVKRIVIDKQQNMIESKADEVYDNEDQVSYGGSTPPPSTSLEEDG